MFSVPPAAVAQGVVLHLGIIDDADVTYLNGTQVGASGDVVQKVSAWNVDREYRVPPGACAST